MGRQAGRGGGCALRGADGAVFCSVFLPRAQLARWRAPMWCCCLCLACVRVCRATLCAYALWPAVFPLASAIFSIYSVLFLEHSLCETPPPLYLCL